MRLYGSDADSVYLQHISSAEAVVIDKVDTLVLCTGHMPVDELADSEWWNKEPLRSDSIKIDGRSRNSCGRVSRETSGGSTGANVSVKS